MSAPGEHKTVQARILRYAQEIGWTFVPRAEAEARHGFKAEGVTLAERSRGASLFFNDTLYAQVKKQARRWRQGNRPRTNHRSTRERTCCGTAATSVVVSVIVSAKHTCPSAFIAITPSITPQWKRTWGLSAPQTEGLRRDGHARDGRSAPNAFSLPVGRNA